MALLLAAFTAVARGQAAPQAPPLSPEQVKHLEDLNDYWKGFEQWRKEAGNTDAQGGALLLLYERYREAAKSREKERAHPQGRSAEKPPPARTDPEPFFHHILFHPLTCLIAVGTVLLGMAGRLYLRLSATTDPAKLARSDAWLQAYARQNPGAPGAPAGFETPQGDRF
jgi:hypothetical protein